MQKVNKIWAFFFLGLFGLIMLHQAFPHLHHQHDDSQLHSHLDLAHSGDDHHTDDGAMENEESPYGFFGFLMDMHVHSNVSTDIVILKSNTAYQQTTVEKDVFDSDFPIRIFYLSDNGQNDNPPVYDSPNTYFNTYLSCLDLRGPPALG